MANIFRAKHIISRTGTFSHEVTAPNLVYNTGDQIISGLKDFATRPTVNTVPVLLSGENANGLSALVKNDDVITLVKGQPVYIYGANGNNILVRAASNTGEAFSSKTLGLLSQTLAPNAEGYVTTEGTLEGVDTSLAGLVGDPIWLGPTGNLIFGLAQKPYAPNHLVYLGVVERKQANNGKIYVKIQNGFEIDELHNVNINHTYSLSNEDILRYNSASGLWFNQPLNTGIFQSEINSLSGAAVLTYGDQNISGNKNFLNNISVSGTGIFNALDLGNIDSLSLSGIDISITGSTVNVFGNILISGNPVLTGTTLVQTGVNLQNQISSLSGSLNSSGVVLINTISSLSGNVVFLTGNQIINGLKTFTSGIDIYSGTNSQSLRVFNWTGLNSGEFGLFGWQNNQLVIGATQTQSGLLRDVILTGRNIIVNASGVLNIFDPTNISGNLNVTGNILLSGTNILNYINSLSGSLNTSGFNLTNTINSLSGSLNNTGSVLISRINTLSDQVVFTTGNQNIGGNKAFTGITTFSGQEVNLVDTALNLSGVGDMTFSGTNINFINSPVLISGTNLRIGNNIIYSVSPRTSGTSFTPDANLYTFFDYVLTGNSTLNEPTNMTNGESVTIFLNQDSSGSRSMSFNSNYLFSNGITPSLNFVPSGVDIMQVIRVNNRYFTTFASNY